ncbi:MAG: DUF1731 domain-containing protein [Alphaproteobacteria bacterium]|nr:DUF1731 domain-containing protein [Alphaproteobacteria bacterium]
MTEEMWLCGQTILPTKATAHGFNFAHPWMCRALTAALAKS